MNTSKANEALVAGLELDDEKKRQDVEQTTTKGNTPSRTRSLSDVGAHTASPSPSSRNPEKRTSRDDSSIDKSSAVSQRSSLLQQGLTLKMPSWEFKQPSEFVPASPNFEKYATNMLPRHSRGMDYSRAATNLHHSTLADQSSPESSPTTSSRIMNIPCRSNGLNMSSYSDFLHNNSSLWSSTGNTDQMTLSSSLGSTNLITGSGSSESCSDEDDLMDDIDDSILSTPQSKLFGDLNLDMIGDQWSRQSPSNCSPINFQLKGIRNTRKRKNLNFDGRNKSLSLNMKAPIRMYSNHSDQGFEKSKHALHTRRESISWAANQLQISGNENDDGAPKYSFENIDSPPITPSRDGQRNVIRRPVTRRGNMLPKTKGFARIQAALAEESAPVETEVLREAAVVRQTRESDIEFEPRQNPGIIPQSPTLSFSTRQNESSQGQNSIVLETNIFNTSHKDKALSNSKINGFWEISRDDKSHNPPQLQTFPRSSACGFSTDMSLDSPINVAMTPSFNDSVGNQISMASRPATPQSGGGPAAMDMTQKLSKKRFRDDDFDIHSFKRRAVSPGMSSYNSPIIKSPMQRDHAAWGGRPSSSCNLGESGKSPVNTIQKRVGLQGMMDTNDSLMKMSIE